MKSSKIDVINIFHDGWAVDTPDLTVLKDDKHFLPLLLRNNRTRETLKEHPELERILEKDERYTD